VYHQPLSPDRSLLISRLVTVLQCGVVPWAAGNADPIYDYAANEGMCPDVLNFVAALTAAFGPILQVHVARSSDSIPIGEALSDDDLIEVEFEHGADAVLCIARGSVLFPGVVFAVAEWLDCGIRDHLLPHPSPTNLCDALDLIQAAQEVAWTTKPTFIAWPAAPPALPDENASHVVSPGPGCRAAFPECGSYLIEVPRARSVLPMLGDETEAHPVGPFGPPALEGSWFSPQLALPSIE
jgi:hypothetical protein